MCSPLDQAYSVIRGFIPRSEPSFLQDPGIRISRPSSHGLSCFPKHWDPVHVTEEKELKGPIRAIPTHPELEPAGFCNPAG
jgi:hypothetical protein